MVSAVLTEQKSLLLRYEFANCDCEVRVKGRGVEGRRGKGGEGSGACVLR